MKSRICAVLVTAALILPAASFAHITVTRAQVRAELDELASVGYHAGAADGDEAHYPEAIQAAEARISAQKGASAYGGMKDGTAQSGGVVSESDWKSMYSR